MISKNLKELREAWLEKRNEVDLLEVKVNNMLKIFRSDEGSDIVTFHDLSELSYGIPYHVNDKVSFVRLKDTEPNAIVFLTTMKPGGTFGRQSHDVKEVCDIIKGNLIEKTRNDHKYVVGEIVEYGPYEIHKPYTDTDSVYKVTFKRKNINLTPH